MNELFQPILLASYPRSGNTFLRNIFMDVFGVFSWNSYPRYRFLKESVHHPNCRSEDRYFMNDRMFSPEELRPLLGCKFFKTHNLPEMDECFQETHPFVIYLIRDGRDAVVSEAHHRSDIIEPGSPLRDNLLEAVKAEGGSHFGGWSGHTEAWLPKSNLVLHFEQLITEPERCVREIASIISLPEPDFSKMPTFESQREGNGAFVHHEKLVKYKEAFPKLFFRRGLIGGWKDEMKSDIQALFMTHHGAMLDALGYLNHDTSSLKYRI